MGRFERALAQLEGTGAAIAFASGNGGDHRLPPGGAGRPRNHVAAVRPLYGGTDALLASGLLGLDVSWEAARDGDDRAPPGEALVLLETPPRSPTLGLVDIGDVVEAAAGVAVLVDNTFATPVLNPARHGDARRARRNQVFGRPRRRRRRRRRGHIETWAQRLQRVRILTGALMHPLAAYLLLRGLPTLPMRVHAAQGRATVLARLGAHPAVTRVFYLGCPALTPTACSALRCPGPAPCSRSVMAAATPPRV